MQSSLHIVIPSPCHENWDRMTPREQGSFCSSCQKTVIDFTGMTDREILDHLSRSGFNTCGRLIPTQLNRELVMSSHKKQFSLSYIWKVMVSVFLLSFRGNSRNTIGQRPWFEARTMGKMAVYPVTGKAAEDLSIDSSSDENTQYPAILGEVSVVITDTVDKATAKTGNDAVTTQINDRSIMGDTTGSGVAETARDLVPTRVTGYMSQQLPVAADSNPAVVMPSPAAVKLGSALIQEALSGTAGGLSVTRICRYTPVEKLQRKWDEWKPVKEVKIFPNPVSAGQSVTIMLRLKDYGEYNCELMDATGRIVNEMTVTVSEADYRFSVPVQTAWAKGMYWLRVSGKSAKKAFHAKLIVQ